MTNFNLLKKEEVLVFGIGGQIANSLATLGLKATYISQSEADFTRFQNVINQLETHHPKIVINCAAYTAVDQAEDEKEICKTVNAETPGRIAQWCYANKAILIHFSTDYVFSGNGINPWAETDSPEPQSSYGMSKLLGDQLISQSNCQHIILRISWVYSDSGKNFLLTMLKLGKEKSVLKVVHDQIGYPAYADDIAEAIIHILPKLTNPQFKKWGTYHLVGQNTTSWHSFAEEIFRIAKSKKWPLQVERVIPISTSEYPTKAPRPLNSRMNGALFLKTFGFQLPKWEHSLEKCMVKIDDSHRI